MPFGMIASRVVKMLMEIDVRNRILRNVLEIVLCGCLCMLFTACDSGTGQSSIQKNNRIYFYNISGSGINVDTGKDGVSPAADLLIIESNGHYGLVDSGHRYEQTIIDSDGVLYSVPNVDEQGNEFLLSSQIKEKNGKDAAAFCHEKLGINHFDFIIASHAHSDHIGGLPYFAEYVYEEEGSVSYLVDESTVFLYKQYHHINENEDDLAELDLNVSSWHNQAFIHSALAHLEQHNVRILDISMGMMSSDTEVEMLDYSKILEAIESVGLMNPEYTQGKKEDHFDDFLSFEFGSMQIQLYNLFSVAGAYNDNVNSIATVITVNGKTFLSAGDLECEYQLEQRIARIIGENNGCVDVMKANHHGYNGSNTKELLDILKPTYIVISRGIIDKNGRYDSMPWYYCQHIASFNKGIYEVGLSDRGIMIDLDGEDTQFYNIEDYEGTVKFEAENNRFINNFDYEDGWYNWPEEVLSSSMKNSYYYIRNNELIKGWFKDGGFWYYLNDDSGKMMSGWQNLMWNNQNSTYYFTPTSIDGYPEGAMVYGNRVIDGVDYSFDNSGRLVVE